VILVLAACGALEATTVEAQPSGVYVLGTIGIGSLADDEGSLGSGRVLGGAVGWVVSDHLTVEGAFTQARHRREGSLAWEGKASTTGVRLLYRFNDPEARVGIFAGGGLGYFRYPGTFTETRFDAPFGVGHPVAMDWRVSGWAWEFGTGLDFSYGHLVVRPEAWFAASRPTRVRPAPEPPYYMPRLALSVGARF
jgi:hypothetical protein